MLNKPLKALNLLPIILGSVFFIQSAHANLDSVPLPDNTEVRMALDDDMPMVLSGFVKQDISEVMTFYREQLGEPQKVTQDIGRYTYFYKHQGNQLRVSFYQQNTWCEISVMLSK